MQALQGREHRCQRAQRARCRRARSYRSSGLPSKRSPLVHPVRKIAPISMRKTIGQAIEIVAIVQVFWSGLSCGPNAARLALELLSLRRRHQPEIVFGVLEVVLRGDRVASCVSVARQLKVSLRHMQRRATNSDLGPASVI
jgi:hypothetical protein